MNQKSDDAEDSDRLYELLAVVIHIGGYEKTNFFFFFFHFFHFFRCFILSNRIQIKNIENKKLLLLLILNE
jgi:hypothetical protein